MSPDVFRRLALIAGCSGFLAGVSVLALYTHWVVAIAAALGFPLALALTIEATPDSGQVQESAEKEPQRIGLSRREIERRARMARPDTDA